MRQSQLFTKTRKEVPADEASKNAKLLIQAGYIQKEMAGVYDYLPLGLKVINKIKKIVAEEMESIGSNEIIMSTLQNKEIWEKTGRWDDHTVDVWFKSQFKNNNEVGFGWSHEEPITEMMKSHISSYKDFPVIVHQFQNKLRNEVRAKSGIMRGREFVMKDMYCFACSEEENNDFYNKVIDSYLKVYQRLGLGDITYVTSASGGVFTDKFSHEFQTVCNAGEDIIYVNKEKNIAINEEVFNEETLGKINMRNTDFIKEKSIEVGNIFNFGTKKSEQLDLYFIDKDSVRKPVYLSSYGIGVSRVMGTVVEALCDDKGIVWPESITPFSVHLLSVGNSPEVLFATDTLYQKLNDLGIEVLYDDRDLRPGEKFADSDLLGIPKRIVVSDKTLEKGVLEVKDRRSGEVEMMEEDEFLKKVI
jgi:prolyl-tRNA synthetase